MLHTLVYWIGEGILDRKYFGSQKHACLLIKPFSRTDSTRISIGMKLLTVWCEITSTNAQLRRNWLYNKVLKKGSQRYAVLIQRRYLLVIHVGHSTTQLLATFININLRKKCIGSWLITGKDTNIEHKT